MATREDYDIVLRATDQTAPAFASATGGANGLGSAVGALRTTLGALGVALSGAELIHFTKEAVTSLADIGSSAKRVGATTDALQALRFEVKQGGGDIKDADTFLQRFAESASKAGTGGNYLAKVFFANGVALKDANGQLKSSVDLLVAYAKLVDNTAAHEDKLRLAREAGGKGSGAQMLEVLEKIARQGLPSVIDRLKELGIIVDKNMIDKADQIDKKWKLTSGRIDTYLKGTVIAAMEELQALPHADSPLAHFLEMVKGNEKFSITFDATIPEGSPLAWLIEKMSHGGVMLGLSDSFSRRFGDTQLTPPSTNKAMVEQINDYLKLADATNKAGDALRFGRGTKLPLENDALEKQISAIAKHVAAVEADARSVDATAGAHAQLRTQMQLMEAVQNSGIKVAGDYAAKIDKIAQRAGAAADMLAVMKLKSDILFERAQLGRTEMEQDVAARLRGAKIDPNSAQGEFLAQQIRINDALKDTKALSIDVTNSIVSDLRAGKSAAEAFANALNKIADKLQKMAVDQLWAAAFPTGGSGLGGLVASLFGGRSGAGALEAGNRAVGSNGLGFAGGGEFQVGGAGGVDSQLVAFRASPTERVRIFTPGQSSGGGGNVTIAPTYNIDARGSDISEMQLRALLARNNAELLKLIKKSTPDIQRAYNQLQG